MVTLYWADDAVGFWGWKRWTITDRVLCRVERELLIDERKGGREGVDKIGQGRQQTDLCSSLSSVLHLIKIGKRL
jgi:hypothetical protein